MLSPAEQDFIARNITSADHDYFVWSGLVGEPFLCEDILCYFDGETVAVVGHSFQREDGRVRSEQHILTGVIAEWCRRTDVSFINYFGPCPLPPLPGTEWALIYSASPRDWNREIFLDLTALDQRRYPKKIRGQLRVAARLGLKVTIVHRESLGYEHIQILRSLALRRGLAPSDAGYIANVISVLRSPATLLCEVRAKERLCGFMVSHEYFPHRPFLQAGAFDRASRGASDAAHVAIIDHYRRQGATELGMGYTVDEGLFRFKTKWPGARVGPPCYQCIWQRRGSATEFNDCLHWPWRLLTSAVHVKPCSSEPSSGALCFENGAEPSNGT